jgi:hypothetical protein
MIAKVDVSVSNAIGEGTNHPIPYVYMVREVRAALAAKYYWDVDFANCQPAILKQRLEGGKHCGPGTHVKQNSELI